MAGAMEVRLLRRRIALATVASVVVLLLVMSPTHLTGGGSQWIDLVTTPRSRRRSAPRASTSWPTWAMPAPNGAAYIVEPGTIHPRVVWPQDPAFGDAEAAVSQSRGLKLCYEWRNIDLAAVVGKNANVPPENGTALCELMLLGMPHVCRIEHGAESMMECVDRVGASTLERALPSRCTATAFWKGLRTRGPNFNPGRDAGRDRVVVSQTSDGRPSYISPSERVFRRNLPVRRCADGTPIHTLTFAVPKANILPRVTRQKLFDFVPYNPGKFPPWQFPPAEGESRYKMGAQDEFITSVLHKHSYFGFTHKRGGWDCMRHVEQMAHGIVPYMADIHLCGEYCLAALPKDLLHEALELPGVSYLGSIGGSTSVNREFIDPTPRFHMHLNYVKIGKIDWNVFNTTKYFDLADRMLDYTQKYLSTRSLMAYVLNAVGYEEPDHVLVVVRGTLDYLEVMVEQGIAELGIRYTVTKPRTAYHQAQASANGSRSTTAEFEVLRTTRGVSTASHGADMVVGMRIPPAHVVEDEAELRARLLADAFDLVIYTWAEHDVNRYPLWVEVRAAVPKARRVFLNGMDDDPGRAIRSPREHGHVFKREGVADESC
jgi:hypothetical protein